jgi:ribosomal protein L10
LAQAQERAVLVGMEYNGMLNTWGWTIEDSVEELKQLAAIPSRDGLLTMFAAGLMEHVKNVAICLDLHSQNLEEEK